MTTTQASPNPLKRLLRRIWRNIRMAERPWAYLRLLLTALFTLLIGLASTLPFRNLAAHPESWLRPHQLSCLIVPVLTFFIVLVISAAYVGALYGLPGIRYGLQYIIATSFGFGYPRLLVNQGKAQVEEGAINLVTRIGGPGILGLARGNAALVEHLNGRSRLCKNRPTLIARNERLRFVVSLEDQEDAIPPFSASSKDGFVINVKDVRLRYRVFTGRQTETPPQSEEDHYNVTLEAMQRIGYDRRVRAGQQAGGWQEAVKAVVRASIVEYLNCHKLNDLLGSGPGKADTRQQIAASLEAPDVRKRLEGIGAELIWVDIGHFDVTSPLVKKQWLENWGADKHGEAWVALAYGHAEETILREMGRAEAQADMLQSIINAMGTLDNQTDSAMIRKLFLLKTSQLIAALGEDEQSQRFRPKISDPGKPPPGDHDAKNINQRRPRLAKPFRKKTNLD